MEGPGWQFFLPAHLTDASSLIVAFMRSRCLLPRFIIINGIFLMKTIESNMFQKNRFYDAAVTAFEDCLRLHF